MLNVRTALHLQLPNLREQLREGNGKALRARCGDSCWEWYLLDLKGPCTTHDLKESSFGSTRQAEAHSCRENKGLPAEELLAVSGFWGGFSQFIEGVALGKPHRHLWATRIGLNRLFFF